MLRSLSHNGFASIVEVIVTSVVFVIAAAGIMTAVSLFKPQEKTSSRKMEAAYIGKGIIDDLRRQVSAEDWWTGGSNLDAGTYSTTVNVYTVVYTITTPSPSYRHLTMNITWPDP